MFSNKKGFANKETKDIDEEDLLNKRKFFKREVCESCFPIQIFHTICIFLTLCKLNLIAHISKSLLAPNKSERKQIRGRNPRFSEPDRKTTRNWGICKKSLTTKAKYQKKIDKHLK